MTTEAEILTKVSDLLAAYSEMLAPSGGSKLLTLNRASGSDAALSTLQEAGAERWRYGILPGGSDLVLQWSTDGSELGYVDRLRIDGSTGAMTVAGGDAVVGGDGVLRIVALSESEYAALPVRDPATLYVTTADV